MPIRLLPPLTISKEEMDEALRSWQKSFKRDEDWRVRKRGSLRRDLHSPLLNLHSIKGLSKHLLKLLDCSTEEIIGLLDLADQLKYEKKHNISHRHLEGKSLGMIFQKSSTRTRVSFETGMYQLGGQALFLSNRDLQIGRGEPVQDTARVLSRYLDGIMIRTYEQKEVEDLAKLRLYSDHQRSDRFLPSVSGSGRPHDHPREVLPFLRVSRCATSATATTWQTR